MNVVLFGLAKYKKLYKAGEIHHMGKFIHLQCKHATISV